MARKATPKPATRYLTRRAAAKRFEEKYGVPISYRSIERWSLPWQIINGRACTPEHVFDAEADRRIHAGAVIQGGRSAGVGA